MKKKKRKPTYLDCKGYRIPSPFPAKVSVTTATTTFIPIPISKMSKTVAMMQWKECSGCKGIFRAELKECPRCKRRNIYKREYQKLYMRAKRDKNGLKYDPKYIR